MIGGGTFRLSHHRGRLLVLDFWASWCAPCAKALPKLAQLVAEMEGDRAELLAINLREPPEEAKAALERMGVKSSAALDRDGAVAARYGAASIPYTVLVGRDGKVMRVFAGSSPRTETQLREILETPSRKTP
jgi:thiol-disulfide isomerase/thioredoxin